jgi:succinate-semialdehyde dehydrogenase/glutarate-semialdehyde dehydrogenase
LTKAVIGLARYALAGLRHRTGRQCAVHCLWRRRYRDGGQQLAPAEAGGAIASKYRNAGQTCVCANRILVQDGVYDAFTERLAETAGAMKVADGFEPGAVIGPLIDMKAVEKVEAHIADAVKKGAKVVTGGKRAAPIKIEVGRQFLRADGADRCDDRHGHHQGGDLRPGGPALPLQERRRGHQKWPNDTEFGLASYFYSRDIGRIWRVAEALEYGIVGINEGRSRPGSR